MSDHIQTEAQEPDTEQEQSSTTTNAARQSDNSLIYDKQSSLTEIANSTFQELCKTLESEQAKLLELEERRKKLQEEMLLLKAEIEEEKQSFNLNIKKSVAGNLSLLNKSSGNNNINVEKLLTCYEDNEQAPITARHIGGEKSHDEEMVSAEDHTQNIKEELQNVLTECIIEQCTDKNE